MVDQAEISGIGRFVKITLELRQENFQLREALLSAKTQLEVIRNIIVGEGFRASPALQRRFTEVIRERIADMDKLADFGGLFSLKIPRRDPLTKEELAAVIQGLQEFHDSLES